MTDYDLDHLDALYAATTQGKWEALDCRLPIYTEVICVSFVNELIGEASESIGDFSDLDHHANAEFTAAIHTAYPAMVKRLRELEDIEAQLEAARNPFKQSLYNLMSDISEECYCAGWSIGNEFVLWGMVLGAPRNYGMGVVSEEEVYRLKSLSSVTGGWWTWGNSGPEFKQMDEWVRIYEARKEADHAD